MWAISLIYAQFAAHTEDLDRILFAFLYPLIHELQLLQKGGSGVRQQPIGWLEHTSSQAAFGACISRMPPGSLLMP